MKSSKKSIFSRSWFVGAPVFGVVFAGLSVTRQSNAAPHSDAPLLVQAPASRVPGNRMPIDNASAQRLAPPASVPREQTLFRGLQNYYAQAGAGFGVQENTRNDPSDARPIGDSNYTLSGHGLIGWGPVRAGSLFFNAHYRYSHEWETDFAQATRFWGRWFGEPRAEYFLFPTRSQLRVHEFASDLRYTHGLFQAGLFSRISVGRVGSSVFGESEFDEEGRTVVVTENFVPYLGFRYKRFYRGQIFMPFRTEINKDNPLLSNATYSWNSRGRGRIFSVGMNNAFYFENLDSLLYADFFRTDYKYYSILGDRTRLGTALSFDFPVVLNLRATPKFLIYDETFAIDKVRIPNFRRGVNPDELGDEPQLVSRSDSLLGYGISIYYDLNKRHRLFFNFQQEQTVSTITEFNSSTRKLLFGYTWSLPGTITVSKRVGRFDDSSFAEEF